MVNKRELTFNPLSYKGIRRFPPISSEHGRRWDKKQQCFVSHPSYCREGDVIVSYGPKGARMESRKPCHACQRIIDSGMASGTSEFPHDNAPKLRRISGLRAMKAFYRP